MIGRTVSHYRIDAQLGAGGMGIVYRAEDTRLGRSVALKFLSEHLAHDPDAVRRLRSEARAASALNHGGICTIYDIDEVDGHPFIVMELLKGRSLRDLLVNAPLRVHQLVDIGIEIADALQAAHAEGIVHRDITPANIFVTDQGHVKILDFGLAKLASLAAGPSTTMDTTHQTAQGMTLGTVAYMSPEQATGEELDARTDLFSAGVVLYECATGRHPFPGKTSPVILAAILNRAPVAPMALNPDLPLRLQEVINNCLEKDRELRYQSAGDLRADLKRVRRDLDSGQSRIVEVASPATGGAHERKTAPVPSSQSTRGRSIAFAVAAVSAALLVTAYFARDRRQPTVPPATPQTRSADSATPVAPVADPDPPQAAQSAPPAVTATTGQRPAGRENTSSRELQRTPPASGVGVPREVRAPVPAAVPPPSPSASREAEATSAQPVPAPAAAVPPPTAPPSVGQPLPNETAVATPVQTTPAAASADRRVPESRSSRPTAEEDEAAIRRAASMYAHAIEAKDLALFRSIKPNLSREEERRLQDGFRAVSSQRVALTVVSIERHGDDATVKVKRRDTIETGGRNQTIDSDQILQMTRASAGWVVVAIR
jgi:serine/threonine protein kinase